MTDENDYTPPDSHNLILRFKEGTVTPDSHNLVLRFGSTDTKFQSILAQGLVQTSFGITDLKVSAATIAPYSIYATDFSNSKIYLAQQFIRPIGGSYLTVPSHNIRNFHQSIVVTSFNALSFGSLTKAYNLKQEVMLSNRGINSNIHGTAYVQGGVKSVEPKGLVLTIFPNPNVVNTRANQVANLTGYGITPIPISKPDVSPRIVYPSGIRGDIYGQTLVQRNPNPKGFINTLYGVAWISHSPRYLIPGIVEAYLSGYPKVFDPTQKTFVTTVIAGGVFGDISVRNSRRLIKPDGLNSQQLGEWSTVESTRRSVEPKPFSTQIFGDGEIRNKTPSFTPVGLNSLQGFGSIDISYRIRTVKPSGFYQPKIGSLTFAKTPGLAPRSINPDALGTAFVSNRVRSFSASLGDQLKFSTNSTIWHYSRNFKPNGIKVDNYGLPRIEHGQRLVLFNGFFGGAYGNNAWVSFGKRRIEPPSIDSPGIHIHRVGGTQHIRTAGYIATLFGSRIIPESQSVYANGFSNIFGMANIDLWVKYAKPTGFLSTGQEGGHRFGSHKFWNLQQFIVQFYDADSGLVPPKWTGWTGIVNRNKRIGTLGNDASRVPAPSVNNNARPLLPSGIKFLDINKPMIAERVRRFKLEGLEAPYFGGWHTIYNSSLVIAPKGPFASSIGISHILNTRRYFNRIGNLESLEMGVPMISDRIRTLSFESRYTIVPPYLALPKIALYTRYIEEVGKVDELAFGNAALTIHWKIITPRWTLRDDYGSPAVKNVTPELVTRGRNSEEFGNNAIRLQWRPVLQLGNETALIGKNEIAFRDRKVSVPGFTQWKIPTHKVIKTGAPPYTTQYIWLDDIEMDGSSGGHHGIREPDRQVSPPSLKTNVIFPEGFVATEISKHYMQSNGILVQPGLQELSVGTPVVWVKNKIITVPSLGDLLQMQDTLPRLSPWTIYAVTEAPPQAIRNHGGKTGHYVNSYGGTRNPGEEFGRVRVTLRHRKLTVGIGNVSAFSNGHSLVLRKRYVNLTDMGISSLRMGVHVVGPFDQSLTAYDSTDELLFGKPSVVIPYTGAYYIKPNGMNALGVGALGISHFNRSLIVNGSDYLQMGARKSSDTPFMWQGLRVGPLVTGNYGGFENQKFGVTNISLWVRNITVQGFESFVMEYDYTQFNKRMRVVRQELPRPQQPIMMVGSNTSAVGVPDVRAKVHYIRPDGNSDQYRKGVPQ